MSFTRSAVKSNHLNRNRCPFQSSHGYLEILFSQTTHYSFTFQCTKAKTELDACLWPNPELTEVSEPKVLNISGNFQPVSANQLRISSADSSVQNSFNSKKSVGCPTQSVHGAFLRSRSGL